MKNLLSKALQAAQNSYSPYSKFKVGAAVELDNGEVVTGTNFENASYGLTMCAERIAIYIAQNRFPDAKIITLAIASPTLKNGILSPCGACREVMSEVVRKQGLDFRVIMQTPNDEFTLSTASELLPIAFRF